jgi:hypothetical protein
MHVGKFTIIPNVISDNNDHECLIGISLKTRAREKVSCQKSLCYVAYTQYPKTVLRARKMINIIPCSYNVQNKHIWMDASVKDTD